MPEAFNDSDYQFHISATDPNGVFIPLEERFSLRELPAPGRTLVNELEDQWTEFFGDPSGFSESFDEFVNLFLGPRAQNARPRDFESFIELWNKHAFGNSLKFPEEPPLGDPNPKEQALDNFRFFGPGTTQEALGYWADFDGAEFLGGTAPPVSITDRMKIAFEQTFSAFISEFDFDIQFNADGSFIADQNVNPQQAFIDGWIEWLQRTTLSVPIGDGQPNFSGVPQDVRMQGYASIYQAYLPAADPANFRRDLVDFANRMFEEDGYFYPNHFVERWVDELKSASLANNSNGILNPVDLDKRVKQALILNEMFDLLVDMIGVIQQATAALAQRLRFFSEYQNQLTKLMDQIAIFHSGQEGELATPDVSNNRNLFGDVRSEANAASQAALEFLRAHRDMVGDETKQLQTTVNQLNDAASQQGNIATAILQQLSGILTLIFR